MSDTIIEVTVDPPVVVGVAVENIIVEVAASGLQGIPGPQGPPGGNPFVFSQISAVSPWTVNHNLGRKPVISVLSMGGVEVVASVIHASDNQAIIEFATPTAGQAICI